MHVIFLDLSMNWIKFHSFNCIKWTISFVWLKNNENCSKCLKILQISYHFSHFFLLFFFFHFYRNWWIPASSLLPMPSSPYSIWFSLSRPHRISSRLWVFAIKLQPSFDGTSHWIVYFTTKKLTKIVHFLLICLKLQVFGLFNTAAYGASSYYLIQDYKTGATH